MEICRGFMTGVSFGCADEHFGMIFFLDFLGFSFLNLVLYNLVGYLANEFLSLIIIYCHFDLSIS